MISFGLKKIFSAFDPVSKVVLSYLLLASLWICFSDQLVNVLADEKKGLVTTFQTYKGLFFVSTTTVLLYVLIRRINSKLEQSREQVQKIMDQSPAVICTLDEDGRFVQVNSAVQEIWGYSEKDLVNKKFMSFLHPDDVDINANVLNKVLKGAKERNFENRYVRPDGSIVWMKWTGRWDAANKVVYCIGTDTTALKEAKERVVEERNMLRAIIDNIPDYIFAKDRQQRLILSNKAMNWAILGEKSEKKGLGKTAFNFFKPEIAKAQDDDDRKVIDAGELLINREETVYDSNGEKLWLQTTKVPLRNQNNDIYGLVGITRNITKKKKAEDRIRHAKEQYEMVMKATSDTVYDWSIATNKLSWGNNFESSRTENYSIKYWLERIHPEDQKSVEKSLKQTLESSSETKWESEYRYINEDGTYDTILEKSFIIRDKEGTAVRMIGALQDITVLKKKENELTESLKEKQILLSEVHHRVKNNLAVVSGMIQLQAFDEEKSEIKNKLMESVSRIQSMAFIHEYLYQSNSFSSLDFSANLKKLIRSIRETIQTEADVSLRFKIDSVQLNVNQAMPAALIVNEIVTNILKHAFKGMGKGKIVSELAQVDNHIKLIIKDNGKGLAEDFKKDKALGHQLINELSKQIEADYEYKPTANGSEFILGFKKSDSKGTGNANL